MRISPLAAFAFAIVAFISAPEKASAGVFLSITVAPPALPVYVQPPVPGEGYIWSPGYWAWSEDDGDYYWVPGAWVAAPTPGLLWTPGYWGWNNGVYAWNAGYWGPHVGFYGGISYGFGYGGVGYAGGRWAGGSFQYNRSVTNISNTTIINNNNTYNQTVNNTNVTKTSFNGGNGGVQAQPTPQERQAALEPHTPATKEQTALHTAARTNPNLRAAAIQKSGGRVSATHANAVTSLARKQAGTSTPGNSARTSNLARTANANANANPKANKVSNATGNKPASNFARPKTTSLNTKPGGNPPRRPPQRAAAVKQPPKKN